jgi:alginate O-acetyltransferase complex protein AlgI
LGFFKYFNFLALNYTALVESLGLTGMGLENVLRVTLPLGISFYTFQSMSYAIDVYRGDARRSAIRSTIGATWRCFRSLWPGRSSGFGMWPISFASGRTRSRSSTRGIAFLGLGLGKKILLANPCGKVADMAFDAGSIGCLDSWVGVGRLCLSDLLRLQRLQRHGDRLGLMLGFMFAKNFDSPYLSQSITEFWRRWHLSLSTWLRDNLYYPLGGNRKGPVRTYINLALVMLLGGLWHGAAWNFVIWGAIHGLMLILERLRRKARVL